jgi:hypothetical protein
MKLFLVIIAALVPCNASYYSTDYSSYGSSSSSSMSLNTFEPEGIHDFLQSADELPEDNDVPANWYKLDANGKELKKVKNYQNNILRIILDEIADQFADASDDRGETLQKLLEYLNNFIDTHYIPRDYRNALKTIYKYVTDLQNTPKFNAAALVYKELSDQAKQAFKDGRRVQTNGLDNNPNNNQQDSSVSYKADPVLLELLFLQMVIDVQKTVKKRQELLDSIDKKMQKIESVFSNDNNYAIVGSFESIRSALVAFAQEESPMPAFFAHVLTLIKNTKERKELEKKYAETLKADEIPDISADDLQALTTASKTKTRENLWQKIVVKQQNKSDDSDGSDDTDEEYDSDGNPIQKKKKKRAKKQRKGFLANIEEDIIEKAEDTVKSSAEGDANQTVQGLLGKMSSSLKGILPKGTDLSSSLSGGSDVSAATDSISSNFGGSFNLGNMFGG